MAIASNGDENNEIYFLYIFLGVRWDGGWVWKGFERVCTWVS